MEAVTTVRFKNQLSELERLYHTLVQFGQAHHISEPVLDAVNLALEEIITNIISYAFSEKIPVLGVCFGWAFGSDIEKHIY